MAEIPPKPPWIKDDPEEWDADAPSAQAPEPVPERDAKGRFVSGASGNPRGRPKSRYRATMLEGIESVIYVVRQAALNGDMQAAALLLGRTLPPLKAEPDTVEFELDSTAPPPEQRRQIREAVAQGRLTLEQAHLMTDLLDKHQAGDEWHPLIERLKRRKAKHAEPAQGVQPQIKLIDGKSTVVYPGAPNGKDSIN